MIVRSITRRLETADEVHPNAAMAAKGRRVAATTLRYVALVEVPLPGSPSFAIGDDVTPEQLGLVAGNPAIVEE